MTLYIDNRPTSLIPRVRAYSSNLATFRAGRHVPASNAQKLTKIPVIRHLHRIVQLACFMLQAFTITI